MTAATQPAISGCSQSPVALAAPLGCPGPCPCLPTGQPQLWNTLVSSGERHGSRATHHETLPSATLGTALSTSGQKPAPVSPGTCCQRPQDPAIRDPRTQQHPSLTEQWPQRHFERGLTQTQASIQFKTSTLRSRLLGMGESFGINQTQK